MISGMKAGGAETFLMKVYRALDKSKFQMDFCLFSNEIGYYEPEIETMGGTIFHIKPKTESIVKSLCQIYSIVKNEKYKYVMRVSPRSLSALDLLAARIGGAEKLIFRSSNTKPGDSQIDKTLHWIFRWMPMIIPNVKFAPSKAAAEYLFGKAGVNKGKVSIIKNAIPIEEYRFSSAERMRIRDELKCENKTIIGHIGRFTKQKNHKFLLEVFKEYTEKNPESILLLLGEGDMLREIRDLSEKLDLDKKIIYAGIRKDVPAILMAMDLLLLPSLYEGMPNVVIEAQATSLPCLLSDRITSEVALTDLVEFMSLDDGNSLWAEKIEDILKWGIKREEEHNFPKEEYEIERTTRILERLIFENGSEK